MRSFTLPETNSQFAPENGWLEYDSFLLGFGLFSGANCSFQGVVVSDGFPPLNVTSSQEVDEIKYDQMRLPEALLSCTCRQFL